MLLCHVQGHPVGLIGEDGGATAGALSDGVQGIESSEHHNPPEMLDGLDGKTCTHIHFTTKISFRFNIFPFLRFVRSRRDLRLTCTSYIYYICTKIIYYLGIISNIIFGRV